MRIRSLDAMRGIAAAIVVAHHASLIFPSIAAHGPEARWLFATPLRLMVAGPAAVYVFFVLSGTVLALPFFQGSKETWPVFAAKRVVRIWLPFAVAILCSAILALTIGTARVAGTSWWFDSTWRNPLSFRSLASTLAMTGRQIDLDNPMWSLIHELRIAVLLPAIIFFVRRNANAALLSALLVGVLSVTMFKDLHYAGTISWADTSTYAMAFVAGVWLASNFEAIGIALARQRALALIALGSVALCGLAAAPSETPGLNSTAVVIRLIANIGAAALLVALCMHSRGRVSAILNKSFPTYLGRISYSLYLVHVPVLIATVRVLSDVIGLFMSVAVGIGASLLIATGFQRAVEAPAANLSKLLGIRLSARAPKTVRVLTPTQAVLDVH